MAGEVTREWTTIDPAATLAKMRAGAWACSAPGTPYGVTEPQATGQRTPYQIEHPWEFER